MIFYSHQTLPLAIMFSYVHSFLPFVFCDEMRRECDEIWFYVKKTRFNTGLEQGTNTLATFRSTTELLPQVISFSRTHKHYQGLLTHSSYNYFNKELRTDQESSVPTATRLSRALWRNLQCSADSFRLPASGFQIRSL